MDDVALGEHDPDTGEVDNRPRPPSKLWARYGTSPAYPSEYGGNFSSLNLALFNALDDIEPVVAVNTDGARGRYAKFDHIMKTVRPALRKNKLLLTHGSLDIQRFDTGGGIKGLLMPVHTTLFHVASGGWKRETIAMPVVKFDPQAVGSAMSYGKRYTTLACLGLATGDEDDDGERARRKNKLGEDDSADSDLVAKIKGEIAKKAEKGEAALVEWRASDATASLLETLDPDDFSRVKVAYQMAVKKARETPAAKAKKDTA